MLNAIERASIAKFVADYLIDHLLIEEPMSADELGRLAKDITEDRGIADHPFSGAGTSKWTPRP